MDRFDDYTPKIFYTDEEDSSEKAGAEEVKIKNNTRSRKSGSASASRSKKPVKKEEAAKGSSLKESASNIRSFFTSRTTVLVTGIILAGFAAYFLISFISYLGSCVSDQSVIYNSPVGSVPPVANAGGEGGARLSEFFINAGFGLSAFVLVIWLTCVALKLLTGRPKIRILDFTLKCLIGFIALSLIIGLITIGSNTAVNWGGYHGRYVNEWIIGFFGWWGAVILSLVMASLFVVICMRDVIIWILSKKRAFDERRRQRREELERELEKERELERMKREDEALAAGVSPDETGEQEGDDSEGFVFAPQPYLYPEAEEEIDAAQTLTVTDTPQAAADVELKSQEAAAEGAAASAEGDQAQQENAGGNTTNTMIVNIGSIEKADSLEENRKKRSMYQFPALNLLKARNEKISVNKEEQISNKELIRQTLLEYGVPILSIEAHVGPTVTLYEIRPDKGNRIARIKGLTDEIAMSLSAIGVRIIAPIPGRGTIGIEVANLNPRTVSLRSILESKTYQESSAALPIALGSTIQNDVYIADLASIPHLLVAGATGQGKSVGLNVIIMSLLYKKRPDELKFVMFDPKMVEFNLYAAIEKQYLAKLPDEEDAIITDMKKVVPTLNSLCIEMDNRYQLLKEAEVRKLEEYNALIKAGKFKDRPEHRFLPYIVVVVDEFADLIMTAGNNAREVEMPIARLAQKARAVGIHVIIATQRPTATIITGNIKTNFPGRIAFKVSQGNDSKVILDTTGAQRLIGKGDMLILNNSELVRVQCAYVDTPEVKDICDHISRQPYPEDSPYLLPTPPTPEVEGGGFSGDQSMEKDPLYDEIRSYVISSGIASTSNLQRKFQLGYNRAGRIMDQLEADGVVGPSHGGKAREVLIS